MFDNSRLRFLCVLAFFAAETAFAVDSVSSHASTTVYAYRQSTGTKVDTVFRFYITSADEIIITYKDASLLESKALCDDKLNIHSWHFKNKGNGYDITARRTDDTIMITGKKGTKIIKKSLTIDSLPWYQAMEFSLLSFLKSGAPACEFWMIRPTDMNAFKMIARRKAIEMIRVSGCSERVIRVTLSPSGLFGRLWHITCWYRPTDYTFIKSEIPGAPGATPTVAERIDINVQR